MPVLNPEALIAERVEAIRAFHKRVGTNNAELDVSGGLDSAVMLGLLKRAGVNITAVYSSINSSHESFLRAKAVAEAFDTPLITLDLSDWFADLVDSMKAGFERAGLAYDIESDPQVLGSIRSCLRAPIGRGFNRMAGGGIRHGTGNEDEDRFARFYQKGGDGEVDTNPLAMLSKGEVFQLALALGVPREIISAKPSPDLWASGEGHNDEDEFADYFGIDPQGHTFYSYIDPDTGEYTSVGLIERVSRFLDTWNGERINDSTPWDATLWRSLRSDGTWYPVVRQHMPFAAQRTTFEGFDKGFILDLLASVVRVERATRHKYNPRIPMLGSRASLLEAGILTDELPKV